MWARLHESPRTWSIPFFESFWQIITQDLSPHESAFATIKLWTYSGCPHSFIFLKDVKHRLLSPCRACSSMLGCRIWQYQCWRLGTPCAVRQGSTDRAQGSFCRLNSPIGSWPTLTTTTVFSAHSMHEWVVFNQTEHEPRMSWTQFCQPLQTNRWMSQTKCWYGAGA